MYIPADSALVHFLPYRLICHAFVCEKARYRRLEPPRGVMERSSQYLSYGCELVFHLNFAKPPSDTQDLITDSRIRAAEILKSVIPSKIIHLRSLISSETDPKSILYVGYLETGDYAVPRMVQPDHIPLLIERSILDSGKGLNPEDIRLGEKIVSPDDVVVAKGRVKSVPGVLTPESEKSQDTLVEDHVKFMDRADGLNKVEEKGVTGGPHWFEVVPRNKIQTDLIHLLCK